MDEHLSTLNESGSVPKSRLSDAAAAQRIVEYFNRNDESRAASRARIAGMLDGNPPYSAAELRRTGQSHRSNVNFLEAKGYLTSRRSSYYDLVMDTAELTQIKLTSRFVKKMEDKGMRAELAPDIGRIVSEEFTRMCMKWDGFLFHIMRSQTEMLKFGVGPTFFPDEFDWRFQSTWMRNVRVPEGTLANTSELDVVVLARNFQVTELFRYISDPEMEQYSREAGWDVSAVRAAIKGAYEKKDNKQYSWESVQQRLKNNDLAEACVGPAPIAANMILWREFTGKISMAILLDQSEVQSFLFRVDSRFDSFTQILNLFFAEIGDGTYHSVRGLGFDVFAHCEINNRFLNTLVDGSMLSATVLLKHSTGGVGKSQPRVLRLGPLSVLPDGYEVANSGFSPNLGGISDVRSLLQQNLNNNVGLRRPNLAEKTPTGMTARESTVNAQNEAKLEQSDINFYYQQWDRLYREMLRRALDPEYPRMAGGYKEAEAFRASCRDRGVPAAVLKFENFDIQAARAIGLGSPVMKDLNSRELLALAPFLDGKGKRAVIRNRVSVLAGATNADHYAPEVVRDDIPTLDTSMARVESSLLELGKAALAGEGEDHAMHLNTHFELAQSYVQQIVQAGEQVDWTQATGYLGLVGDHVSQHMQFLAGNPAYAEELNQWLESFKGLESVRRQWEENARQQQEEMARQQQAQAEEMQRLQSKDFELERAQAEILSDQELRKYKEDLNHQVRSAKTVHGLQLAESRAEEDMRLKRAQVMSEIEMKAEKARRGV